MSDTAAPNLAEVLTRQVEQAVAGVMLNDEVLKAFVHTALSQKMPRQSYARGDDPTFLVTVVNDAIQNAAKEAVRKVVNEQFDAIETAVRRAIEADIGDIAAKLAKALVDTAEKGYVQVKIELPKDADERYG